MWAPRSPVIVHRQHPRHPSGSLHRGLRSNSGRGRNGSISAPWRNGPPPSFLGSASLLQEEIMRTLQAHELALVSGGDGWGSESSPSSTNGYTSNAMSSGWSGGYSNTSSSSSSSTRPSGNADACKNDILAGGGFGAGVGTALGSAAGPAGAAVGGLVGALVGGAIGSSSANCNPPAPAPSTGIWFGSFSNC